jgi:hypothetical protein
MKKIIHETCSPSKKTRKFSCYFDEDLHQLKQTYNKTVKIKPITSKDPKDIWLDLSSRLSNCKKESCFSESLNVKLDRFAPKAPASWKKNKNEWLSSSEINKVMKQYEKAYSEFRYIGPAPSDYFFIENNQCVWKELCDLNVTKLPPHVTKIGIVFNLDVHDGPGTHWVAVFIHVPKKVMYYFDSAGEEIHKNIKKLHDQLVSQDPKYKLVQNYPKEHQMGTSECGMYVLFFIIMMIHNPNFSLFKSGRAFTDKNMEKFRKKFFN